MTKHRSALLALAAVAALALAGCASSPGGPPRAPGGATPGGAPPAVGAPFGGLFSPNLSPPLEAQRSRLVEALKGTPVTVEPTTDRRLRVEVPTKFAFDPGKAVVKPPLAAVLDQFAVGFKPQAATTELSVAAPGEDKVGAQLVQERAASVRDYLVGRGVPLSRIASLGRSAVAGVEIVVSDRAPNKPAAATQQ